MKWFGLFYLIFTAFMFTGPHAGAQDKSVIEAVDPERLAAAQRFLEAGNFDRQISELLPRLLELATTGVDQQLRAAKLDDQQLAALAESREFSKLLSEAITDRFLEKKSELIDLSALAYARALTVEELDALTEFEISPPGRKFNAALPEIMAELIGGMAAIITGGPIPKGQPLAAEKERAVAEMLEASQLDRMIDGMMDEIAQPTPPAALPDGISEAEIKEMNAASRAMTEQFRSQIPEVKKYVASVWGNKLEVEVMEAVTDFHQTEIGHQILQSMPKIFEEEQKLQEKMFAVMFSDMDTLIEDIIQKQSAN